LAVGLIEALGHDAVYDIVRDEISAIHDLLGGEAHRRLGCNRRAENVSGRQLGNAVTRDQELGLSALACPRGPKKNQPHRRLPPPRRDRFTSPSYCWAIRWLWICVIVSRVTVTMMRSDVPP